MSGAFTKYSDIRWIFCHSGDVVPVLTGRWKNALAGMSAQDIAKFAPKGVDYELRRQFYETADAAYGPSMAALLQYVPVTQILFGTDYPYVSIESNAQELVARHLPQEI